MLRLLVENWELKVLSVVIAVVLWFFVASADRSQIALAAPIEYVGLENGKVLVGVHRDAADVQVEAARWALARVTSSNVRVRVEVSTLHEGDNVVPLSPELVQVPPGVRVTRISPAWVRVSVADAGSKELPVVAQVRGSPAPGRVLARVVVDPPTVRVTGPRSTIETRTAVDTAPVDITGRRESLTRTVGLVLPESVYATNQRTVQVTVEIRPEDSMASPRARGARR